MFKYCFSHDLIFFFGDFNFRFFVVVEGDDVATVVAVVLVRRDLANAKPVPQADCGWIVGDCGCGSG